MTTLPTNDSQCFDNTRISGYKFCPRSYFLRHVLHWSKEGIAMPLVFGLSWHEGMDVIWKNFKGFDRPTLIEGAMLAFYNKWEEEGLEIEPDLDTMNRWAPRTPMVAHEMFWNYVESRESILSRATLLAAEQPFAVPMPGVENTWYIGRLDKTIEDGNQTLVLEHKTTTAYATIGNFRTDYVDSWFSSPQVKGYEFGGGLFYPSLDGVWVDAALVHKKVHDAFKFIPVSHKFNLLEEWVADTAQWITRIQVELQAYKEAGELRPGMFPKNEDNCYGKYGTCPFLDICRAMPDPTKLGGPPPGYVEKHWEPFSVLKMDKLLEQHRQEEKADGQA